MAEATLPLARRAHDGLRHTVVILAYHRVMPLPDPERYPFDLGLISAQPDEFSWQMELLRAKFNPIPLAQVVDYLRGRADIPPRAVVVTFDDGFVDNYEYAFPILRRLGVPATIFLSTAYLESRKPFWFEMATYFMQRAPVGAVAIPGTERSLPFGSENAARRKSAALLLRYLKSLPHQDVVDFLDDMERNMRPVINRDEFQLSAQLDWQQVRTMHAAGVEFGSHTVRHALLAHLGGDDLWRELYDSRLEIERRLQSQVVSLAYPVGRTYAYSTAVMAAAGKAGYRVACSYNPGCNWMGALDPFELRRQGVEHWTTRQRFRATLELPGWID